MTRPVTASIPVFVLAGVITLAAAALRQPAAAGAIPNLEGKILTVRGPIDPAEAGQTLMHEHIFIHFKTPTSAAGEFDQMDRRQRALTRKALARAPKDWVDGGRDPDWAKGFPPGWNTLDDFDTQLAEISEFRRAGGGTIVDVSNFGLSRNPARLQRVSKAAGLNVVMGAGWYQKMFHPRDMSVRSIEELTDIIVRDITVGVQGTRIRAGIIGEIGIEGRPLTDNELKSTRASARASRITGAPMSFHMGGGTPEEKQRVLDIVAEEGVDLNHVVMGHNGTGDVAQMKRITERGAYIEFDFMGFGAQGVTPAATEHIAQSIATLVNAGLTDRILVGQDVCTQMQLKKNGGGGFAYISDQLLPALKAKGVSDEAIRRIMVDNPRRVLTFVAPRPVVTATRPG
ncbi:MAG: TatD family hydrolase [Gammaproteobacteria bacterium]|nr:TatD family hydrolase [Gammaproteobacteria bacterium]